MIYESLFNWVYRWLYRRKLCEHDFEYTGYSYMSIGYGRGIKLKHYKCKKCRKKEKRHDSDAGSFVYF